jgi:hypothetical protein
MSENRHIVSLQNKNTDGENMFEMLTHNLWIIMTSSWACLTMYAAWYFTKVKRYSSITPTEARQLWTIHRHDTRCNGRKWRQVKKGKQTVGFECECGYKHVQKKPIMAHAPATLNRPEVSAFDKLHTSHKST